MSDPRLSLALASGAVALPEEGRITLLFGQADQDLAGLPKDRLHIVQPFRPDHDSLAELGHSVAPQTEGRSALTILRMPRSKSLARLAFAQAAASTDGAIIVDGAKTDGVEGLLRELRARGQVGEVFSKAHGKVFAVREADLTDFAPPPVRQVEGFQTAPGVFSEDGPDPASVLLAAALPEKLSGQVADLGAGWGYLGRAILSRPGVAALAVIEADHRALDCAKANIDDPRASFYWADATSFRQDRRFDAVVMNPPFHTARAGTPALGQAFIAAAARLLTPSGQLWLVANRHLPYEKALEGAFRDVSELAGDTRFKLFCAARPRQTRR